MIIIDSRIGSKHLLKLIDKRYRPKLGFLEFGDVSFDGNGPTSTVSIGIELKNIEDFLTSMRTGRLGSHQIPGLVSTYFQSFIIIEGSYRKSRSGLIEVAKGYGGWTYITHGNQRYMYSEFEQFQTSIQVQTPISLRYTNSRKQTAKLIEAIYTWFAKPWNKHKSLQATTKPTRLYSYNQKLKPLETILVSIIPRLGSDRARRLSRKYPTITRIIQADPRGLADVDGIGPVLAGRIQTTLRELLA